MPKILSLILLFITSCLFSTSSVVAQTNDISIPEALIVEENSSDTPPVKEIKEVCCTKIEELEQNIREIASRRNALSKELVLADSMEDEENLKKRIEQLKIQESDLKRLFEKLSLGGLDTTKLTSNFDSEEEAYDWKAELLQIIQPVFTEMQRMTEGPRKRERLRAESLENETHLLLVNGGLEYLNNLPEEKLSDQAKTRINEFKQNWIIFRDDLTRRQDIVKLSLNDLEDKRSFTERLKQNLFEFAKGRGLVLASSFLAFFGVLYILSKIMSIISNFRDRHRKSRKVNIKWRFVVLFYRLFSFLFALIAFLVVLHSLGDMVLFGLAILILFALLLSFRNYLPGYISELKIFLNFGSARQGERIIYNGIPWQIERVNLYFAYLKNPQLDNGRIRLTVTLLGNLVSRPVEYDEIWFPSKVGECFLLPDGTFVKVLRQTPESMYLESFNSHIIYPTAEFIAAKPKNLSMGYYTVVDFGLGYKHFNIPVDEVFAKIREAVIDRLSRTDLHDKYNTLSVEFRRVNEGMSLLYTVILSMKGSSVDYYYQCSRLVQEACLRCAQQYNWEMPFTQVTLRNSDIDTDFSYPKNTKIVEKTTQ